MSYSFVDWIYDVNLAWSTAVIVLITIVERQLTARLTRLLCGNALAVYWMDCINQSICIVGASSQWSGVVEGSCDWWLLSSSIAQLVSWKSGRLIRSLFIVVEWSTDETFENIKGEKLVMDVRNLQYTISGLEKVSTHLRLPCFKCQTFKCEPKAVS